MSSEAGSSRPADEDLRIQGFVEREAALRLTIAKLEKELALHKDQGASDQEKIAHLEKTQEYLWDALERTKEDFAEMQKRRALPPPAEPTILDSEPVHMPEQSSGQWDVYQLKGGQQGSLRTVTPFASYHPELTTLTPLPAPALNVIPTPGHVTPLQQVIPHTSKNIVEKQEALVEEPADERTEHPLVTITRRISGDLLQEQHVNQGVEGLPLKGPKQAASVQEPRVQLRAAEEPPQEMSEQGDGTNRRALPNSAEKAVEKPASKVQRTHSRQ
ncbi:g2822 [Coccomyxa viridis]|uniref:G2822 protein n=1 Tax=Coccomyxa viridis TaxID=1274662 RepID=A0ABP1FPY1_9CHLO